MEEFSLDLSRAFPGQDIASTDPQLQQALFEHIRTQVAEMLDTQPDLLFSYLYRLDVDEARIKKVLSAQTAEVADGLSKLIIDRQLQRMKTRREYAQKPPRE